MYKNFIQKMQEWSNNNKSPTISVALINISMILIASGLVVVMYYLFEPGPVRDVRTVSITPSNRVIDRTKNDPYITVVREVDMKFRAQIQLVRLWIDDGGGVNPSVDGYIDLEKGKNVRSAVRVSAPGALNPGKHFYRVTMRWCNPLKCVSKQLEDIDVIIIGYPQSPRDRSFEEHRF